MAKERQLPALTIGEYTFKKPIVQGGMSIGISGPQLAVAVFKEGGLPTVGGVGRGLNSIYYQEQHRPFFEADRLALRDALLRIKEINPNAVFAVNILKVAADYDNLVRTAVEYGAKIIVSGAGLPMNLPQLTVDRPEVALIPIVSSAQGLRIICKRWWKTYERLPDAIVIEAPSTAGGHLGVTPKQDMNGEEFKLEVALPESLLWLNNFKEEIKRSDANTPIIVAGGIWGRPDIDKVLALGAQGVQMGTRFVCTEECEAPIEFKRKYLNATPEDIVIIESPVGIPGRAIKTEFLDKVLRGEVKDRCIVKCMEVCKLRNTGETYCIIKALSRASQGDVENGIVFAGSNAWRSKEQGIVPVHQIFEELTG